MHISPSLVPSITQPLTSSFPVLSDLTPPTGHHPATPRFLLSLLATSVYLSIPSLASQALASILSTVGPHTVLQYLNFALGKSIGPPHPLFNDPETAVGLEHVAEVIDNEKDGLLSSSVSIQTTKGKKRDISDSIGDLKISKGDPSEPPSPQSGTYDSSGSSEDDDVDSMPTIEPVFHYGSISDKIGETAACWLARWGVDMLAYEEGRACPPASSRKRAKTIPSDASTNHVSPFDLAEETLQVPLVWRRGGLSAKWVAAVISADTFFVRGERERYEFARSVVELRRRGGIIEEEEQEWRKMFDKGLYYSNMVCVAGCSLRFSTKHPLQSMEDVIFISQDISPITNRTFVPLPTLQAAHWSQSVLRHLITVRPSPPSPPAPSSAPSTPTSPTPPRDKELGIAHTTADILTRLAPNHPETLLNPTEGSKPYFPVPIDSSLRIGDNGSNTNTADGESMSMDQLFTLCHSPSLPSPNSPSPTEKRNNSIPQCPPTSEATFFGLLPVQFTASSCITADPTGKSRWSQYPPYRFAVEFWDLDALKEKSRLHSHTIWYAGSLFNVYVQIVRKKGQSQLGVYLHRQSSIEPIPPASAFAAPVPPVQSQPQALATVAKGERERGASVSGGERERPFLGLTRAATALPSVFSSSSPTHFSPSIHPLSRSTTPNGNAGMGHLPSSAPSSGSPLSSSLSSSSSSFGGGGDLRHVVQVPVTTPPVTPPQAFRDPRAAISAYFTVSCASATGASQTRFTSAPDVFSVSQSWGWKSSSLRTEEYLDVGEGDEGGKVGASAARAKGREVSFRATVVLGLV